MYTVCLFESVFLAVNVVSTFDSDINIEMNAFNDTQTKRTDKNQHRPNDYYHWMTMPKVGVAYFRNNINEWKQSK